MCGRIALVDPKREDLKKRFNIDSIYADLQPRYNISPSQEIPVILNEAPKELVMIRWGLLPHWAKEENTKYKMINAKAETITEKPAYRGPIKYKRCLILADSFYEWQSAAGGKRPYRVMLSSEGCFALAGIWDCWQKEGKEIYTCCIITTDANALMKPIHDRMPVILPQDEEEVWLSDCPIAEVLKLLKPYNAKKMKAYEISKLVNSPNNDIPEVIHPI